MAALPPCKRTVSSSGFDPCGELGQPGSARVGIERLALQARSLGHPTRLSIVAELATRCPLAAGDIAAESGLARSTISEHLRLLREAHLICACHDGPNVRYRLQPAALREFAHGIAELGMAELGMAGLAEDSPGLRDEGPCRQSSFGEMIGSTDRRTICDLPNEEKMS